MSRTGPIRVTWTDDNYSLLFEDSGAEQLAVLIEAVQKYNERNRKYKDNWRRMGWRGMLVRVRERAERLWDDLWNAEPSQQVDPGSPVSYPPDLDDAIDLINFAGFLIRAVRENNRNGTWWDGI